MRIVAQLLVSSVLAAVVALPATAVTYTAIPGAPDAGAPAGQSVLVDFNGELPDGYTLGGSYAFATNTSGNAASPAGDASRYLYTSSAVGTGVATLSTLDQRWLGLSAQPRAIAKWSGCRFHAAARSGWLK